MIAKLFVIVAVAGSGCAAASQAPNPTPTGKPTFAPGRGERCIPLFATSGFAVPHDWTAERKEQGRWRFTLFDGKEPEVSWVVVGVERMDRCTPLGHDHRNRDVPLDPAFPDGYAPDSMQWSGSGKGKDGTDGQIATSACVKGDKGALYVIVFGYQAVVRPQVRALLAKVAEATDGLHACELPR